MISLITKKDLEKYHKILPIRYGNYLAWLDSESNDEYQILSTVNVDIRDRVEWNKAGREVYDAQRLQTHAEKVCEIIRLLELGTFMIQHEYQPGIWLPIADKYLDNQAIFKFKALFPGIDMSSYNGGFKITGNDIDKFMKSFIGYPFLLHYKDIDLFSLEIDLVIKITHHLSVDFITLTRRRMHKIAEYCQKVGLNYVSFEG